jgi:hypothetical protein
MTFITRFLQFRVAYWAQLRGILPVLQVPLELAIHPAPDARDGVADTGLQHRVHEAGAAPVLVPAQAPLQVLGEPDVVACMGERSVEVQEVDGIHGGS